jgi:hypothetical protein
MERGEATGQPTQRVSAEANLFGYADQEGESPKGNPVDFRRTTHSVGMHRSVETNDKKPTLHAVRYASLFTRLIVHSFTNNHVHQINH